MESTVVCVDNSEWTRNGDYAPTRFLAQADAVNLLAGAKTQHHPENTVGVMSMAGRSPRVWVTPTTELGKVLNAMTEMEVEGDVHLATAVQIAQLALKHRENKNQRQRIVIFIGSPIQEDKDTMVKIAKKLKKNNVAVDVVSFGSESENVEKLEAFQAAVNSNGNSHLVTVPAGTILSDMLFATPIFMEEGAADEQGGGGAAPRSNIVDGFDYGELGVDPTLDPELALALRVSMEEERARQAAAAAAEAGGADAGEGSAAAATPAPVSAPPAGASSMDAGDMDEDALLQEALALSMQSDLATPAVAAPVPGPTPAAPAKAPEQPAADTTSVEAAMDEADEDMDPELALALQMSLAEDQPDAPKEGEDT